MINLVANQLTGFYTRATLALTGLKMLFHLKSSFRSKDV